MDAEKVKRIRKELPAVDRCVYLNTGTNGPLCRATAEIMQEEAEKEYLEGRYLPFIPELYEEMDTVRMMIGEFIGAEPAEVALTHSATEGINIILWGMNWRPGDEVITTNREHVASLAPLSMVSARFDVDVKYLEVEYGDEYDEERFIERFRQSITSRSRLLVISHVSFSTGMRYPLKRLAGICHDNGMMILIDGAQGAGATDLDVRDFGIDFYAMAGRKWLLGPEGLSALYVAKDRISQIRPTFISPSSVRNRHELDIASPYVIPAPFAARYQTATAINRPILLGFREALRFLRDDVGKTWLLERIVDSVTYLRKRLVTVPGLHIVTPPGHEGAFLHFHVEGWEPKELCNLLNQRNYMVRPVPDQHLPAPARISVGFYNTRNELDGLVDNIAELVAGRTH